MSWRTATKKVFYTAAKSRTKLEIAEAWIRHTAYLSTYDRMSLEEKQRAYAQVEPALTFPRDISDDCKSKLDQLKLILAAGPWKSEEIDKVVGMLAEKNPNTEPKEILSLAKKE